MIKANPLPLMIILLPASIIISRLCLHLNFNNNKILGQQWPIFMKHQLLILSWTQFLIRDASPGPDGFNVAFYRATWPWIGDDVTTLVHNFYRTGTLPPEINKTFFVLIPKKNAHVLPQDFRPISLCNVIYKVIAKSLADRIKPHLPNKIHLSQSAFIPGRHISSNIITAQQITHTFGLSSWKNKGFLLKIDLAKAFDRIEWSFITSALSRNGFPSHVVTLIKSCISTPEFSVLVNGQPSTSFLSQRGVR